MPKVKNVSKAEADGMVADSLATHMVEVIRALRFGDIGMAISNEAVAAALIKAAALLTSAPDASASS